MLLGALQYQGSMYGSPSTVGCQQEHQASLKHTKHTHTPPAAVYSSVLLEHTIYLPTGPPKQVPYSSISAIHTLLAM